MKIINQDLTKFSTIRTKSHAEYYCEPKSISQLKEAIKFKKSKHLSIVILGNGSNILFSRDYYDNWDTYSEDKQKELLEMYPKLKKAFQEVPKPPS